jgi:hypothetical protein
MGVELLCQHRELLRPPSADAMRLYQLRNARCAAQPLNKSVCGSGAETPGDWFTLNIDGIGSVLSGFLGDLYHALHPFISVNRSRLVLLMNLGATPGP